MATYSYPNTPAFLLARASWGRRQNVIVNVSRFTGGVERLELPGSRWVITISYAPQLLSSDEAADVEAFWMQIGGPANLVQLWHPVRPIPRGTMRGSPVLSAGIAQGATVLPITTTAAATLKKADMVKAFGMLFEVVGPATANGSGAMSVSVAPSARLAVTSGTAVEWDRPTALFMPTGEIEIPYDGTQQMPFSVELVEVW